MSEDTEWKTIRVPKDVYQDAKERKKEHGVTWGEYVNPHAWHSVFDAPTDAPTGEITKVDSLDGDAIMRKLEQIENAQAGTVSESVELAEDAAQDHEEILGRIDDLESQLPAKITEELR